MEAPWDFTLNYTQFTLPTHFEKYKQADACFLVNSTEILTQWIFCLLLEFLDFSLVSFCVPYQGVSQKENVLSLKRKLGKFF